MEASEIILIVGRPKSAKTTFLAKLYLHINNGTGTVKLAGTPENIVIIEDAIKRQYRGEETATTPTEKHGSLKIPVWVGDKKIELVCPDYGGEQIDDMLRHRGIDETWLTRLRESNNWVLFIRPGTITKPYDLSTKQIGDLTPIDSQMVIESEQEGMFEFSEQAQYVELLQFMLYVRGYGQRNRINEITLSIVLTCWDELQDENVTPQVILNNQLPLLSSYVSSTWAKGKLKVFGVAPQGLRLDTEEAKKKYREELPENFGFFVNENGKIIKDVTALIPAVL